MIAHVKQPLLSLRGLRILIPRGGDLGAALHDKIVARGGIPTIAPLLETAPPADPAAFAAAVARWNAGEYDWIVVTSATTATALEAAGIQPKPQAKTAAVGPVTAAAIQAIGFPLHVMPGRDYSGRGLAESLLAALPDPEQRASTQPAGHPAAAPVRILLPVSDLADDTVERALVEAGYLVDRVGAYTTAVTDEIAGLRERAAAAAFDVVLATSGSAARAIAARLAPLPPATHIAAIGAPTARALTAAGLRADSIAVTSTTDGLLDAVAVALIEGARESYEHTHQGDNR
ncbi:uroporphyrinogen-III synthase [Leucobacter exalbidus]|uniref:Uroporphyrinogen-III synthase n=1 Tax=Leucobacter exalbidus TaxID=662960 RepID=A0A940T4P2_9MICO|nr:uroporphyrinogen-III synthase [Leucobacter exalbidus]MBP1327029.1 uroporphyrinogen-III synthase [Leucobacter exalbidus]